MTATTLDIANFYALLAIPRDATLSQIKQAYRRLLLQSHPDKRVVPNHIDIALVKEAYTTLSNPDLRALYDARNNISRDKLNSTGPRPAQVISLDDFEQDTKESDNWRYPCRCGGWYKISTTLMEQGDHLIVCSSCSEVIWVGYEEIDVES